MKTTLLFSSALAFAFAIGQCTAQIPNSGFEDWTQDGNYFTPDDWVTTLQGQPGPYFPVTRSADHFPSNVGMYSLRLENDPSFVPLGGGYGMAITGSFNFPFEPAFPIAGNPTNLYGYYKYNSVNEDTAFIKVVLFNNGVEVNSGNLLDDALVVMSSVAEWTSFNLQLDPYSAADSATIWISAFYPSSMTDLPNGNSVLYVDNLSFDGLISSVDNQVADEMLKVYPNPANDVFTLSKETLNIEDGLVQIHSMAGVLMLSEQLQKDEQRIDVSKLANGCYVVSVVGTEIHSKLKLVVEH
ncbi:MAG: T9SS type A sorting domain-containing protein [Flavobacteriales bacterium]|nr:T9SS type A sorting domain-containing protein [Flavobacteriales bacterium]